MSCATPRAILTDVLGGELEFEVYHAWSTPSSWRLRFQGPRNPKRDELCHTRAILTDVLGGELESEFFHA